MYNFYRWYPQGKIIFVAPTKPLVAQQIEACYSIMGIPLDITSEMTGEMAGPTRRKEWLAKRVFYLTPQTLSNDITRGTCPVSSVKCLVLDEAHKATGHHSYVEVVQQLSSHGAVLRILALSATPGTKIQSVQEVIRNLHISRIELRDEDSPDIAPYSHQRNVEKVVVPLGGEIAQIKEAFLHILGTFARRLMNHNLLFTKDLGSLKKFHVLASWETFRRSPPTNIANPGALEADFGVCVTLTHALDLLLLHGIRSFYNFLSEKTLAASEGGADGYNRTRNELSKIAEFRTLMQDIRLKINGPSYVSHPKLTKLRDIVLQHMQRAEEGRPQEEGSAAASAGGGQGSRIMIFSQYRDSVQEIASLFDGDAPLVRAMSFVGHATSKGKGLTQADQLRVVSQFRSGNYNVLVSTCVGEEGLDIGEVNMIICYDVPKSSVRLVQRMGRTGRKRDGRIVVLLTQGREENDFNQTVRQKKSIQKTIIDGASLRSHLSPHSPRMIPMHLNPRCHEMPMTVLQKFSAQNGARSNKRSSTRTSSSVSVSRCKTGKAFYLSPDEQEFWNDQLKMQASVPVLPTACLQPLNRQINETLRLDKWLPWQSSPQPTRSISHSTLSNNYVDIVQLIQEQQDNELANYERKVTNCFVINDDGVGGGGGGSGGGDGADGSRVSLYANEYDRLSDGEAGAPSVTHDVDENRADVSSSTWMNRGLFSPIFIALFSDRDAEIDKIDLPSPGSPQSLFAWPVAGHLESPAERTANLRPNFNQSPVLLARAKQQTADSVNSQLAGQSGADLINLAHIVEQTPPKQISVTAPPNPSPILSQRAPFKRKLALVCSSTPTKQSKRYKCDPTTSDAEQQQRSGRFDSTPAQDDQEDIMSLSQIVEYINVEAADGEEVMHRERCDLHNDFSVKSQVATQHKLVCRQAFQLVRSDVVVVVVDDEQQSARKIDAAATRNRRWHAGDSTKGQSCHPSASMSTAQNVAKEMDFDCDFLCSSDVEENGAATTGGGHGVVAVGSVKVAKEAEIDFDDDFQLNLSDMEEMDGESRAADRESCTIGAQHSVKEANFDFDCDFLSSSDDGAAGKLRDRPESASRKSVAANEANFDFDCDFLCSSDAEDDCRQSAPKADPVALKSSPVAMAQLQNDFDDDDFHLSLSDLEGIEEEPSRQTNCAPSKKPCSTQATMANFDFDFDFDLEAIEEESRQSAPSTKQQCATEAGSTANFDFHLGATEQKNRQTNMTPLKKQCAMEAETTADFDFDSDLEGIEQENGQRPLKKQCATEATRADFALSPARSSDDSIIVLSPVKKDQPVVVDLIADVTPPKLTFATTDDSPLVARRPRSKWNLLSTQVVAERGNDEPARQKRSKLTNGRQRRKITCSFIEQEASVSSDASHDEIDDNDDTHADSYEPSFVDDFISQDDHEK